MKFGNNRLKQAVICFAVAALAGGFARAATSHFTFDSAPTGIDIYHYGDNSTNVALAGAWFSTGGSPLETGVADSSTNGYFALTQTTPNEIKHGQKAVIVFPDADNHLTVVGFTLSCDVRLGAGSDRPADGFSICYARAGDSVLTTGNGFSSGPGGNPDNAPEEGTTSGLVISFDAYQNTAADTIGLTIKSDNVVLTNFAMPTLNGACDDITSLQTGTNTDSAISNLCWQPLWVNLTEAGLLNVSYKGVALLTNYPVAFAPSPGQLVIAGRTGGLWQEQDVDNIALTTVASSVPTVGNVNSTAFGWSVNIYDSGTSTPTTNTIAVTVDGATVTPTAITQSGNVGAGDGTGVTTVSYDSASVLFPTGSQHTNTVHFEGTGFAAVDQTRAYTVAPVVGTLDRVHHYLAKFEGTATYGSIDSGRSSDSGDIAVDFGDPASSNSRLRVDDKACLTAIHNAFLNDTLTVSFWERRHNGTSGGVFWIYDAAAPGGGRAFHLHCPYYNDADETVFFDTGGTDSPGHRYSAKMTDLPAYSGSNTWWTTWRHVVAIKNGGAKQVWIDGQLLLDQTEGAFPLGDYSDISRLVIGNYASDGGQINAWMDDVAIYSTALSSNDVVALYNGTEPDAVPDASTNLLAWWDLNDGPVVGLAADGNSVVVNYNQVLQSSTNASGPFTDVTGATSPYTNSVQDTQMFFRTRKYLARMTYFMGEAETRPRPSDLNISTMMRILPDWVLEGRFLDRRIIHVYPGIVHCGRGSRKLLVVLY